MKPLISTLVVLLTIPLSAQPDTTFSELRGMDDAAGVTHLFYRKYSFDSFPPYWIKHNDVYHLNLVTQSDTLIFEDYYYYTYVILGGPTVNDFEFWDNDPGKYIYGGAYAEVDPEAQIWRYDAGVVWQYLGEAVTIELSQQNDSLLYGYHYYSDWLLKSTDGGYNWWFDSTTVPYFSLIALSPFNDQILFSTDGYYLYKSSDGGMSYAMVDSTVNWEDIRRVGLFFDGDSLHMYGLSRTFGQSHFLRSTDGGDSWTLLLSDSSRMNLSLDASLSGEVFLSIGSEIKVSLDYGSTFDPYWQLNRPVVGMYKKPNSDFLYAATTKDIYEVTPADTVSLKHLSTLVSVDDNDPTVARRFELHQSYPNPFNPTTTIRFDLPKASQVEIAVFNIAGQKVATIFEGQKTAGSHSVEFDGSELSSGIYFYRMVGEGFADVKKMVLMR